jgi:hypothetical protein
MRQSLRLALAACLLLSAGGASAQDQAAYNQRNIARFTDAYRMLDVDGDGRLTRDEARGNLDIVPRWRDIDVDGDDVITSAELSRFLADHYGLQRPLAAAPVVVAPPAPPAR